MRRSRAKRRDKERVWGVASCLSCGNDNGYIAATRVACQLGRVVGDFCSTWSLIPLWVSSEGCADNVPAGYMSKVDVKFLTGGGLLKTRICT